MYNHRSDSSINLPMNLISWSTALSVSFESIPLLTLLINLQDHHRGAGGCGKGAAAGAAGGAAAGAAGAGTWCSWGRTERRQWGPGCWTVSVINFPVIINLRTTAVQQSMDIICLQAQLVCGKPFNAFHQYDCQCVNGGAGRPEWRQWVSAEEAVSIIDAISI